jgi:hypothetical protein
LVRARSGRRAEILVHDYDYVYDYDQRARRRRALGLAPSEIVGVS